MNFFKTLPFPAQVVISALLMAGTLAFGWKVFPNFAQQKKDIQTKDAKLKDLEAEISKGINLEKQLPQLERDIAAKEAQLNHLKTVIPPFQFNSDILQKFESLAKRSRLDIANIKPQKLRRKDFYDEYPLQVQVSGNYHDLAKFFERMARLPRIFNVSGVKMQANRNKKNTSSSISASFTAVTFIYREGAVAGPVKKATKKKGPKKPASEME